MNAFPPIADSASALMMIILCATRRDKQEDTFEAFPGPAHEAIRSLVGRAIKSGDRRRNLGANDLLRTLVGVSNVASGPPLTRYFEDRPHKDTTDAIV